MITRRGFLAASGLASSLPALAQVSPGEVSAPSGLLRTVRSPLAVDLVRLTGWLGERLDRAQAAMDDLAENTWWNVVGQWGYTLARDLAA
ncbi:MAG: hypothetical protein ACE15E_20300 [Acidobacteriota bacterium]